MPNSAPPFQPTTSVLNDKGEHVAWDLLEQSCKEIGLPSTAQKYGVKLKALHARKKSHKWRGCPDARTIVKVKQGSSGEVIANSDDLSQHIAPYRARMFKLANDSLGKKKSIPLRNAKDFDTASRIAERMLGIGDDDKQSQHVLIAINELAEHEAPEPIEADVVPCSTDSQTAQHPEAEQHSLGDSEAVKQGSSVNADKTDAQS
jgi:hypothetical protein